MKRSFWQKMNGELMEKNAKNISEYVTIEDASFPAILPQQLEFSSPARGTMNIVHTGMLIPESHQIFVCAKGCLRGVVLTAAEMGAMGRYSALEINEENVLNGDMETMMIEGVADIIGKLSYKPKAILLFISCQHFFLAYDRGIVFETLRERFPEIDFTDCYMIPTLRKSGITPDQKMRVQLYSLLEPKESNLKQVNLMGSNHAIEKSCEIYELVRNDGRELTSINESESYEDYKNLASGALNIIYEPIAKPAAEDMERRLGIPWLYLPCVWRFEDIEKNYELLRGALSKIEDGGRDSLAGAKKFSPISNYADNAMEQVKRTLALVGNKQIAIDYTLTFRPLSLTRFLLEQGFNVTDIFIDAMMPEEEEDFKVIRSLRPELRIHPTNRPNMRFVKDLNRGALALGQKAACFMGTDNFVNIAEGGGLFGYDGIIKLMELMQDAYENPKDRREVVQKKGTKVTSLLDTSSELDCCSQPSAGAKATGLNYSAGLVPTYSSDEFGICQTLYELGGMVVMHDASGCNSTYTTHDEPRWYDHESMVYISAISEAEAIMGDDGKLIKDIKDAAASLRPEFIAVVGAPIPYMIGTDLKAIAAVLEEELGIPCIGFDANGMQGYGKGISMATKALVERFVSGEVSQDASSDQAPKPIVNILGSTPLDLGYNGSIESIKEWLNKKNFAPGCSFSMDSSLEEIKAAANADINLVLTYGGLAAAKLMKRKFGIPYVCGVPYGLHADRLADVIHLSLENGLSRANAKDDLAQSEAPANANDGSAPSEATQRLALLIGEGISSVSLANAIELEFGLDVKVLCATDGDKKTLREQDLMTQSEDAIIRAIGDLEPALVIADPFYKAIVPEGINFIPKPHEAFSGRIYDGQNLNFVDRSLRGLMPELEKYTCSN